MESINRHDAQRSMPYPQEKNLGVYDTKIRVLIVDDHDLMRKLLSDVLALDDDILVVARAADGEEALRLVEEVQPDMIVLDFAMPEVNGIDVMRALRRKWSLPVLMVSVHVQPSLVRWAQRAGAQGYLPKLAVAHFLALAVRAVAEGQPYFGENNQWPQEA